MHENSFYRIGLGELSVVSRKRIESCSSASICLLGTQVVHRSKGLVNPNLSRATWPVIGQGE
jgi:hypothetical protein